MISAKAGIERMVAVATTSAPNPAIQNLIQRPGTVAEIVNGDPSAFLNEVREQTPPELRRVMLPTLAPPSEADINVAATTVAAITEGAKGSIESLLRVLLVLRGIDNPAGELFEVVLPLLEISADNVPRILKLVQGIQFQMDIPAEAPQHEQDWAEAFRKALARRDYHGIVEFLDKLDRGRGIPTHPLAEYFAVLSAKTAPSELASHLDSRADKDFLVIHACLRALPFQLLIEVAFRSRDFLVKLHSIHLASKSSSGLGFSYESVSAIIRTLSGNKEGWLQMCRYFGEFPSRYPLFWPALGQALQTACRDEIVEVIQNFSPNDVLTNDKQVREILDGLMASGCSNVALSTFLDESVKAWKAKLRRKRKRMEPITELGQANFHCATVEAFQKMGTTRLRKRINRLLAYLDESDNRWFGSTSDFISHRALFATYLMPYLEAYCQVKLPGDISFESNTKEIIRQHYDFACFGIWPEGPKFSAWVEVFPEIRTRHQGSPLQAEAGNRGRQVFSRTLQARHRLCRNGGPLLGASRQAKTERGFYPKNSKTA